MAKPFNNKFNNKKSNSVVNFRELQKKFKGNYVEVIRTVMQPISKDENGNETYRPVDIRIKVLIEIDRGGRIIGCSEPSLINWIRGRQWISLAGINMAIVDLINDKL